MAPIVFTRSKAEKRPRRIVTKDLNLFKPQEDEELSPLEMEKKFVVCKSPEESTTPETVDSMIMTFSDDSFDENADDDWFGDACQFDDNWWKEEEESTPPPTKNSKTTTNRYNEVMTPFSKLAMESTNRRLPLSPLDTNNIRMIQPTQQQQPDVIKPIKMNKKDTGCSNRRNQDNNSSSKENNGPSISPFLFSKHKSAFSHANNKEVKSPEEIKADLDTFWRSTRTTRQPYVSPFSKNTLARNAEGKHTMPPIYSASLFTPVKEKSLTTPFSKRKNNRLRGSPLLSPLDSSVFRTPGKQETPEPKTLFDLSVEEGESVVEIKINTKSGEEDHFADYSVVSGLTKILEGEGDVDDDESRAEDDELAIDALASYDIWGISEVDDGVVGGDSLTSSCCDTWGLVVKDVSEDSFDAGDGLLSSFLHNFMISTPPGKR